MFSRKGPRLKSSWEFSLALIRHPLLTLVSPTLIPQKHKFLEVFNIRLFEGFFFKVSTKSFCSEYDSLLKFGLKAKLQK